MSYKIKEYTNKGKPTKHYYFYCPGCMSLHAVNDTWKFNGDYRFPTFAPSALVTWTEGPNKLNKRCHFFIKEGRIQFLNDCTHNLKGKTVDLPNINKYV